MNSNERAQEIVTAIVDIARVDLGDKRSQVEAYIKNHLDEMERCAAEKTVSIYRHKTAEASDKILSGTTIGGPTDKA